MVLTHHANSVYKAPMRAHNSVLACVPMNLPSFSKLGRELLRVSAESTEGDADVDAAPMGPRRMGRGKCYRSITDGAFATRDVHMHAPLGNRRGEGGAGRSVGGTGEDRATHQTSVHP